MEIKTKTIASNEEQERRLAFYKAFKNNPIPESEQLSNVGIFTKRQDLTKQLFFNEIYKNILQVHGVIMEFGVRWGQNLVTLNNLRGYMNLLIIVASLLVSIRLKVFQMSTIRMANIQSLKKEPSLLRKIMINI